MDKLLAGPGEAIVRCGLIGLPNIANDGLGVMASLVLMAHRKDNLVVGVIVAIGIRQVIAAMSRIGEENFAVGVLRQPRP